MRVPLLEEYLVHGECSIVLVPARGVKRAPQRASLSGQSIYLELEKQPSADCHLAKPECQQETGAVELPQGTAENVSGARAKANPQGNVTPLERAPMKLALKHLLHEEREGTSHSGHCASAAGAGRGPPLRACVAASNGAGIFPEVLCLQNYFHHAC